jgi:hypothetical protein
MSGTGRNPALSRLAWDREHPDAARAADGDDVRREDAFRAERPAVRQRAFVQPERKGEREMPESGKVDEIKGRVEEAAGALRDDEEQRRKGQADQSSGKLKQADKKLSDAADEVKGAFKKIKGAFKK